MRKILTVTAVLMATATAASAMKATDLDIDGDGFASITEVRQIFPGFSSNDFRDIDVNRDRRLSNKELNAAGTRAVIGRYESTMSVVHGLSDIDTNGDRFASRDELNAVYSGLLDDEFREIDVNRDGRVNSTELYRPLAQALLTRYEMGGRDVVTIMQVDVDDDAFASFAELQAVYTKLSPQDFHLIDNNGDNRVSATEYYSSESQAILDHNN
ncbi:MAG: hypothetical protein HKN27_12980 [Silicimonas sp.]|nr:hypothetical protein [Silicimonas sp.]